MKPIREFLRILSAVIFIGCSGIYIFLAPLEETGLHSLIPNLHQLSPTRLVAFIVFFPAYFTYLVCSLKSDDN